MAEIAEGGGGGHDKGKKKRAKKNSTKVDMTPMVDLAFLLQTFFVLTSTFSKPKVMSLVYPAKPEDGPKDIKPISDAITFVLSKDEIFYYEGAFKPQPAGGLPATELIETDFSASGVRKLLTDKNSLVLNEKAKLDVQLKNKQIADSTYLNKLKDAKKNPRALKVLIKTDDLATCKNFIDLIDELRIADIGVIAPVDIMASELELLKAKTK